MAGFRMCGSPDQATHDIAAHAAQAPHAAPCCAMCPSISRCILQLQAVRCNHAYLSVTRQCLVLVLSNHKVCKSVCVAACLANLPVTAICAILLSSINRRCDTLCQRSDTTQLVVHSRFGELWLGVMRAQDARRLRVACSAGSAALALLLLVAATPAGATAAHGGEGAATSSGMPGGMVTVFAAECK